MTIPVLQSLQCMTQSMTNYISIDYMCRQTVLKTSRFCSQPRPQRLRLFSSHSMSNHEKKPRFGHLPLSTSGPQKTTLTGNALLRTPYFNKGSAFSKSERDEFKLHGLLPANVQTLGEQVERAYAQYTSRPDDLAKNTFMTSMKEQNEVLYYRVGRPS
jgi:hypothetical protein